MEQISTDGLQQTAQPPPPVQPVTIQAIPDEQAAPNIPPKLPSKSLARTLLLIVLILGILTGGGYFVYSLTTKKQPQNAETRVFFPTAEPTKPREPSLIITDNFDNLNLDTQLWSPWTLSDTSRAVQNNGKIEIEIPAGFTEYTSAGVDSTTIINANADFEATVDAEIVQGGDALGSEIALVFHEGIGEWTNQLSTFLVKDERGGVKIGANKVLNGENSTLDFVKSFDYAGPFTISLKREKGTVTFSYKEGTEFVTLGQLTSNYYGGSGILTLHVNTLEPNFPGVISTFDNFVLKLL